MGFDVNVFIVSISTALTALFMLVTAFLLYRSNKLQTRFATAHNFSHRSAESLRTLADLYMNLSKNPDAFRFHGVCLEKIDASNITREEFAYLAANFVVGQIFHDEHESTPKFSEEQFKKDKYRKKLAENEDVKEVWPELKILFDNTRYRSWLEGLFGDGEANGRAGNEKSETVD